VVARHSEINEITATAILKHMGVIKVRVTAKVTRTGDWWAIEVPEVPGVFTQAKRLDQVEEMVQDAIAMMTGTEPGSVQVQVAPVLPDSIENDLRQARDLTAQAARLQEQASAATRRVVVELREVERLSVRDVGKLLEVSPQRVSQLAAFKTAKAGKAQIKKGPKTQRSQRVSN
jgi:predicted RNase H-like HicB family nuclease